MKKQIFTSVMMLIAIMPLIAQNDPKSGPCPGMPTLTDSRDGKIYKTVQIGTQCWMSENLNVGKQVNGKNDQHNNGTIEKYCHGNLEANCTIYGGLYQWGEMMEYSMAEGFQGICPTGWHVPTDWEWCTLETYLDATVDCSLSGLSGTYAGGKMKEVGMEHWSPNIGATNSSGFTGLPGGKRNYNSGGTYSDLRYSGIWWSSSQHGVFNAWYHLLNYGKASVYRNSTDKGFGFSIRCLKN